MLFIKADVDAHLPSNNNVKSHLFVIMHTRLYGMLVSLYDSHCAFPRWLVPDVSFPRWNIMFCIILNQSEKMMLFSD